MHDQDHRRDGERRKADGRAAAALVELARLMGRQAALEHFAASCSREDDHGEETAG